MKFNHTQTGVYFNSAPFTMLGISADVIIGAVIIGALVIIGAK